MTFNHNTPYFKGADRLAAKYMEDRIITYAVSDSRDQGPDNLGDIMGRLEDELGINFERVDHITGEAEIDFSFVPEVIIDDKAYGGVSRMNITEGSTDIQVDQDVWHWESTLVHEIGHSLGLGCSHSDPNSIMSYGRDYNMNYFSENDLTAIGDLFQPFM